MNHRSWRSTASLVAMASCLALTATAQAKGISGASRDSLASIVDRAMATGLTPGLQIAVVQGETIRWTAERGFADREQRRKVTPDTRFYIASTTKALTALAAARLAAEGKLDLDQPLSQALPRAKFDPRVHPDSIRVVDLLTHTHGIDSDGPISLRVAFTGDYTYDQLLRGIQAHGPADSGRAFDYSNLGYDLIGIVLDPAHLRGWKEVVEHEVTQPLGMRATTAYRSKLRDDQIAMPYELGAEGSERVPLAKQDANMGPAGGYFSTAGDLARLIEAELNGGRVDGKPCIPADVIAETQRFRVPQHREFSLFQRYGWGLGWDLGLYEADTLVHRFGSFPGYRSHVSFMPRHGLGVAVLVNGGGGASALTDLIAAAIYETLMGKAGCRARLEERIATLEQRLADRSKAMAADRAKRAARAPLTRPLEAYAGAYMNPDYGTLELRVAGGKLEAAMGVARSTVEPYDAAKDQLRVELFGGGTVVQAIFSEDDTRARALTMEDVTFTRR